MTLHILGLPLTPESVTAEFLEFIKQPNVILVQSSIMHAIKEHNNDYVTARTGYDLLFSNGYAFVEHMPHEQTEAHAIFAKQLWTKDRNGQLVTKQVIDIYHELRQKNPSSVIAYITPGSPRLYDNISKNLIDSDICTVVIDTKSSAELAVQYLVHNNMIPDLEITVLDKRSSEIKNGYVNVFGCLGSIYRADIRIIIPALISKISINAKIFKMNLSDKTYAEKLTKVELIRQLLTDRDSFNSTLVVIVN